MSPSTIETLQKILASTKKYYEDNNLTPFPVDSSDREAPTISLPPLSLSSITAQLESRLIYAGIQPQIRHLTLQHASKIEAVYEASYKKASRNLLLASSSQTEALANIDLLRRTFEYRYAHQNAEDFFDKALKGHTSLQRRSDQSNRAEQTPRRFNHDFTPFLEAYLEHNAFPSLADQKLLAEKSGMAHAQIVTWFQNRRSRARRDGREADLKRLPPGQAVNVELIEERIKIFKEDDTDNDTALPNDKPVRNGCLNLDQLASSSASSISKAYSPLSAQPCIIDSEAFGLRSRQNTHLLTVGSRPVPDGDLNNMLSAINIRASTPTVRDATHVNVKTAESTRNSPKPASKTRHLKAKLRSCISSAVTLTCPGSHPALIRKKSRQPASSTSRNTATMLEQRRTPVMPYRLPDVLPTWDLSAIIESQPAKRKKPSIPAHGGRTRPGSPYPQQTISRVSSSSSLSSMASDDSLWSSHTTSSNHSATSVESFATTSTSSQSQSPFSTYSDLADDAPFAGDIWSSNFYSNPVNDNFGFDVAVENPFDMNVSLSIADFDTTTLPTLEFFDS